MIIDTKADHYLTEAGQTIVNSFAWLQKNEDGTYNKVTPRFVCREFFNELLLRMMGKTTYETYGFRTDNIDISKEDEKFFYMEIKKSNKFANIIPINLAVWKENLQYLNKVEEDNDFVKTTIDFDGGDFIVIKCSRDYLKNTLLINAYTTWLRCMFMKVNGDSDPIKMCIDKSKDYAYGDFSVIDAIKQSYGDKFNLYLAHLYKFKAYKKSKRVHPLMKVKDYDSDKYTWHGSGGIYAVINKLKYAPVDVSSLSMIKNLIEEANALPVMQ